MVAHVFNPITWKRQGNLDKLEASLPYKIISRTARAAQRKRVLKNQNEKESASEKMNVFPPPNNLEGRMVGGGTRDKNL